MRPSAPSLSGGDRRGQPPVRRAAAMTGVLAGALMTAATAAGQLSWDAAAEFTIASNPAGAWSYGYRTAPGAAFTTLTFFGVWYGGFDAWYRDEETVYPAMVRNATSGTLGLGGPGSPVAPGVMVVHPGRGTDRAVLRWTAPCGDRFAVVVALLGNTGACGPTSSTCDVHVLVDGVEMHTGSVAGFGSEFNREFTVEMSAGGHLDLELGNGNGSIDCDHIAVEMTVTGLHVTQHPASALACPGGLAVFTAAGSGLAPSFRWQVEDVAAPGGWRDLADGPLVIDGENYAQVTGSGADTVRVQLDAASVPRRFRCVVSNGCGSVASDPATLTICPPDINCSGEVSVQDIFDFLGFYFAADPRGDFNGVGGRSVQDIFDFLAAYFAGCP